MKNDKPQLIKQTLEQNAENKQKFDSMNSMSSEPKKVSRFQKMRDKINDFLENYFYVGFMTLITIYALFGDDIRQLSTKKDADNGFYAMTTVCLGIFSVEILLCCIAKPGYIFGYFFWLDIVSTVSLIFDIAWITDAIFQTGQGVTGSGVAALSKASKASQVGTRAARIVRIIRLIRLVRLVKIYKLKQDLDDVKVKDDDFRMDDDVEEEEQAGVLNNNAPNENKEIPNENKEAPIQNNDAPNENKETLNENKDGPAITPEKNRETPANNGETPLTAGLDGEIPKIKEEPLVKRGSKVDDDTTKKMKRLSTHSAHGHRKSVRHPQKPGGLPGIQNAATNQKGSTEEGEEEEYVETNVGKKLSDLTTRRVIALVLSVMVSIPLFTTNTYKTDYTSYEYGLNTLYAAWDSSWTSSMQYSKVFNTTLTAYTEMGKAARLPLIKLDVDSVNLGQWANPDELRTGDQQFYVGGYDSTGTAHFFSIYDQSSDNNLGAVLSIIRTLFVSVVLTGGALLFSRDASNLVVTPIEQMLKRVKRIAKNPLKAVQMEEKEALIAEKLEQTQGKKSAEDKAKESYETAILERTIVKIGALLALGFGEAGSEIISSNMARGGEVDPMIPGKKIMGIFGFCDIRNFTDATEILQQDVMVFVNEIAEIVHGTVDFFSGSANKNIGDAFLLVWKFPPEAVRYDEEGQPQLKEDSPVVSGLADMALLSFLKVISKVNRSLKLDKYRKHAGLNARMPNYSVKMGFGLHVGWAIEGAIGSEYKIDASYLSPNVNMAARLEAATKQFGVPLLVSGAMKDILTEDTKAHVRVIDKVTVKGSIQPIEMCTVDMDFHKLKINKAEKDYSKLSRIEKKRERLRNRNKRDNLKKRVSIGDFNVASFFETDRDIKLMREPFSPDFYDKWKEGFTFYLDGDWEKAKEYFEDTLNMIPGHLDGPSNTLLEIIQEQGGKAPLDWKGYRELTEK